MSVLHCLACQHESPPTAKFCSECGGQLNLMLCRQCDAINERAWQHCYNCGVELTGQVAHPPHTLLVPVKSKSAARRMRTSRIVVSLLAFAPMAGLAFYLYTQPDLNGGEVHVGKLPTPSDRRLDAGAAAADASTAKTRASVVPVSTSQQRVQ